MRGWATGDECLERRTCVATMAGRAALRMGKALPMGRAAHRMSLGVRYATEEGHVVMARSDTTLRNWNILPAMAGYHPGEESCSE